MSFLWNVNIFLIPPLVSCFSLGLRWRWWRKTRLSGRGRFLPLSLFPVFLHWQLLPVSWRTEVNTHKTVCIPKFILSSTLVADGIFTSASPLLKTCIPSVILRVFISVVGNASPFAICSTSYCVPCEGQAALLSRLPLGALITPLVKQSAEEVSFSLLSLLHILLKMEMKLQYCCYN